MTKLLPLSVMCAALALGCGSNQDKPNDTLNPNGEALGMPAPDPVVYSFVFVGCNRVQHGDEKNKSATNASSANLYALQRIYTEIAGEKRKPELFFFLGDMVTAEEQDTTKLHNQLDAWLKQYYNTSFSPISTSGIELVTVPGNHESLYSYRNKTLPNGQPDPNYDKEFPEKGATEIWMRYMNKFIPANAERVSGPDSLNNRATFSFVRKNIAFVVMNTDTYNDPEGNGLGHEGLIPSDWINTQVKKYRADKSIEHIFVLGHKPYYVNNLPDTSHEGLWKGPEIWPTLESEHVVAMLSAHMHDYQRVQPAGTGTYQVIAGNGGSQGSATFFGYSRIDILQSGKVRLVSRGYNCVDDKDNYWKPQPQNPFTTRDSTILSWAANANPYPIK